MEFPIKNKINCLPNLYCRAPYAALARSNFVWSWTISLASGKGVTFSCQDYENPQHPNYGHMSPKHFVSYML